ncbi:dihydrodipicolinate synthase family protein [Nakamurella sp. A5-74]|uniref:Dihydrodipicolinate synthase family protein n=1 Tax=Nakamurella sp. A5-74 TaxID=3158264 RepID=A0AAU8DTL4_9ACTN
MSSLRKVFSALVTPMRSDESVDLGVLRELVERQLSRGVEGFYCCGSSGEGLLLSHQERRDVVRTVVEQAAGRVPTIAHVGTIRTQDAIDLARAAAADGVTAVSLIPPYYYHWTAAEVLGYYRAVVAAVQVPVVLYNIPQFTRISFDVSNVGDLFADPQVVGMKHTAHDLYTLERLVTQYPEKVFLNGFDEIYLSALAAGATATVGTTVNFQPELFLRVRERFVAGDLAEARTIQTQINCAVEIAVRHGIFPAAKYLAGAPDLPTGDCRAPFRPLDADAKRALEELRCRIVEFTAG